MSSRSCTPAHLVHFFGCHKTFKRLSTHISQNEGCRAHYTSTASNRKSTAVQIGHDNERTDVHQPRNNSADFQNEERARGSITAAHGLTQTSSAFPNRGKGTATEGNIFIDNAADEMADVDDDELCAFDDVLPCEEAAADNNHSNHSEGVPDRHLLDLYQEMQELQSNPLGLDRFSVEEKVHIELLNVLKELRAPMKAFTHILNWAAKANNKGLFLSGLPTISGESCAKLVSSVPHEGINPKGEAAIPSIFEEGSADDLF